MPKMTYDHLENLDRSKSLPPGHIGRQEALKAVQKEYEACHQVQRRWDQRLPRRTWAPQTAKDFCNQLCDKLGDPHIRNVVICSPDVQPSSGAHYTFRKKEIHFRHNFISTTTLIHELAHHVALTTGHGKWFVDCLELLCALAYTQITGRQPNPDWTTI